jgi:hypothetical protein
LSVFRARESHEMTLKEEKPDVSTDSLWFYFRVFRGLTRVLGLSNAGLAEFAPPLFGQIGGRRRPFDPIDVPCTVNGDVSQRICW